SCIQVQHIQFRGSVSVALLLQCSRCLQDFRRQLRHFFSHRFDQGISGINFQICQKLRPVRFHALVGDSFGIFRFDVLQDDCRGVFILTHISRLPDNITRPVAELEFDLRRRRQINGLLCVVIRLKDGLHMALLRRVNLCRNSSTLFWASCTASVASAITCFFLCCAWASASACCAELSCCSADS